MRRNVERKKSGKLRILFVSEYFYPRTAGGEVWSWELCTSLAAQEHEVTVITARFDDSPEDETVKGVHILRPTGITPNEQQRFRRRLSARKLQSEVRAYIAMHKESIDIVHVMAYALNVQVSRAAQEQGIPCITSVHSYFGNQWRKISPAGFLLQRLERSAIQEDRSQAIHVPSKHMQKRIREDTGKETVVIHNWLPDEFPKPKRLPKSTCLYVGSLEEIKNPLACIDATKRLKAKLIVIGTGSLEVEMRKRAAQEMIDCEFLGNLPPQETLAYIGGASLVLVPSITESFSLVALEAVAQGTPVSGTPVGIIPELPGVIAFPPRAIPQLPRACLCGNRDTPPSFVR